MFHKGALRSYQKNKKKPQKRPLPASPIPQAEKCQNLAKPWGNLQWCWQVAPLQMPQKVLPDGWSWALPENHNCLAK